MQVHDLQHTTILTFHFGWLVLRVVCPQVVFGTSHQSSPPGCTRIKWICLLIEFHCTESIGHGLQGYQVVLEVGGKNPWTLNMTQANSKLQSVLMQLESIWCQRVFSPPPCFMSLVVWGNRFPALKCLLTKYCYWNGSVCSAFWSASSSLMHWQLLVIWQKQLAASS